MDQEDLISRTTQKTVSNIDSSDLINDQNKSLKKANYLKHHFLYFALIASLNHALSYVVTAFASSLLEGNLGGIVNGLCWSLNAVSGLTISTPLVRLLGYKTAMIISLWGYAIQIISLYISIQFTAVQWPVAIIGSSIAGFTSAVWWTAQGVCFERTCVGITEFRGPGTDINRVRASMSAYWTFVYQSSDIVVFLTLSLFPILLGTPIKKVMFVLSVLGVITAVLGFSFDPLGDQPSTWSNEDLKRAIKAVPNQFVEDSRAGLLAPFVFGFGITTAMFAYYINDNVIADSIGEDYIGLLEAFSYFVAMAAAYPYAVISKDFSRGRDFVMQFGSTAFMMSGLLVLLYGPKQV